MPFFLLRKQPFEIPPPTEKDWMKKDEEGDFFLKDPDQYIDPLPQPFRMISKSVALLFERAWDIIEGREQKQETKKQSLAPTSYQPSASFQVTGNANCLAASGDYVFIGLCTGLAVYSISHCEKLCAWDAVKFEICVIRVSVMDNSCYLLGTVDEMGFARLFYFFKENLIHVKALNEVEDISKRNACVELDLSHRGDYAGFLLQGSSDTWLEIYRLPKDSWLKETEHVHTVATPLSTPGYGRESKASMLRSMDTQGEGAEDQDLQQLLTKPETKLSPPALLMKLRSPRPLAGSIFKNPFDALMKSDDSSVIGLGQNHMVKDFQCERQEAIFNRTFQQYLEIENELESKEEKPCQAMFHFHVPSRIFPVGTESKTEPDMPVAVSVHWSTSHNLCFYLLSRPLKEKADSDLKPDIVWPCAAPIICSAASLCSSYLAFACEDGVITVWDVSLGFPLFVTVLPEGYVMRSIQFMPRAPLPSDTLSYGSENTASTKVKLLVLCTDGSLHLITSGAKEFNIKLLVCRPEDSSQTISSVATIPALPDAVLIFSWDGTVRLMETKKQETICHFTTPPSYKIASPWQPVFTILINGQCLILRGDEQAGGVKTRAETPQSYIFLFDFTSYSFMETFSLKTELLPNSLEHLLWNRQCECFLRDSLQRLSTVNQQIPECWSQLQKHAAALQRKNQVK